MVCSDPSSGDGPSEGTGWRQALKNNARKTRLVRNLLCLLALYAVAVCPVAAQGSGNSKSGELETMLELYAWLPVDITIQMHGGDTFELEASDLLDNLNFVTEFMVGARKNKWTFFFDTILMDLEFDGGGEVRLGDSFRRDDDYDIDLEAWILDAILSYAVLETKGTRLEVLGGVRLLWEDITFAFDLGQADGEIGDTFSSWDGVVGMRGVTDLSKKWYISYYGDIGAGEADLTWQALLGVNYKFKKFTLFAGWRHIDYQMDTDGTSGGELIDGEYGTGPLIGAKFLFD
jgi:hypothetical protein